MFVYGFSVCKSHFLQSISQFFTLTLVFDPFFLISFVVHFYFLCILLSVFYPDAYVFVYPIWLGTNIVFRHISIEWLLQSFFIILNYSSFDGTMIPSIYIFSVVCRDLQELSCNCKPSCIFRLLLVLTLRRHIARSFDCFLQHQIILWYFTLHEFGKLYHYLFNLVWLRNIFCFSIKEKTFCILFVISIYTVKMYQVEVNSPCHHHTTSTLRFVFPSFLFFLLFFFCFSFFPPLLLCFLFF